MQPDGITDSLWPGIRHICSDDLGIELDTWQDGIATLLLATRADGRLAHTIGGVGMSLPRQCGKTLTLSTMLFTLCIAHPGLLAVWSAHHSKTHMETFMGMQGFARRTRVAPFVSKVYTGSGDEEVRFHNKSRILFGARERGFGRGVPGVDVMVSDEGQILSERAMQNMLATLNTSQFGLHIYCGTPPYEYDNSEMFTRMRDEARSGEAADLLWIECGADPKANIDDPDTWLVNPSYPHRTPVESIRRLRKRLSEEGFRKEGLGMWDDNDKGPFDLTRWNRLADFTMAPPDRVVLMIDVSPDRRWSSIAVAGEAADGRTMILVQELRGTSQTVERVQRLLDEQDIVEVAIFGGGGARVLEGDLTKAGVEYIRLTATDMAAAYGTLQKEIKAGTICHADQPELAFALANAATRWLNTGEAEAFDRRGHGVNISPAVAAAGALYRFGLTQSPLPVIL